MMISDCYHHDCSILNPDDVEDPWPFHEKGGVITRAVNTLLLRYFRFVHLQKTRVLSSTLYIDTA
jgi:hypothetical protein